MTSDETRLNSASTQAQLVAAKEALQKERELRQQAEQALGQVHRMTAIGQLAAGIAHEINTPMQFVGDSVYFLQDAFGDFQVAIEAGLSAVAQLADDGAKQQLEDEIAASDLPFLQVEIPLAFERVRDGISQVTAIVGAMKDFAHPDDRTMVRCDLVAMMRQVLVITRGLYKHVATVEIVESPLPAVFCHPGDIKRVFVNLIANAAEAIADQKFDDPDKGLISISFFSREDQVEVQIRDNGGGIPAAIQERVFEPFFTTKGCGKGTGQGLAIVYDIVQNRHRGDLHFEVVTGEATTFFVRLPLELAA